MKRITDFIGTMMKSALEVIVSFLMLFMIMMPVAVNAAEVNKEIQLKQLTVSQLKELNETIDSKDVTIVSYNEFLSMVTGGCVTSVFLQFADTIYFVSEDVLHTTPNPNSETLKETLLTNDVSIMSLTEFLETMGVEFEIVDTSKNSNSLSTFFIMMAVCSGVSVLFRLFCMGMISREEAKASAFNRAKDAEANEKMMENAKKV